MKFVLGSGSEEKLEILRKSLEGRLALVDIVGVAVASGVSDQPLSVEESTEGAVNRAKAALEKVPEAEVGVGMEGGLESIGGIYNLVCVVAFWDGERLVTGQSGHLPLPKSVSDQIKKGGEFGALIREYQKAARPDERERVNQLTSRELSFTSAIQSVLPQLQHRYSSPIITGAANLYKYFTLPQRLPIGLLKVSAIMTGLYFTFGAVLLFFSQMQGRSDVFIRVNALVPVSLFLILLALGMHLKNPTIKQTEETKNSLLIIGGVVFLLFMTNIYVYSLYLASTSTLRYILEIFGATTTGIVNIIGILAIGIFGYLLSRLGRDSRPSMATLAYIIVGSIGIVESFVLVGGIGTALVTFPVLAVGILWCIGIWSLANELEEITQPRDSDVMAFQKMDKA